MVVDEKPQGEIIRGGFRVIAKDLGKTARHIRRMVIDDKLPGVVAYQPYPGAHYQLFKAKK